MKQEQIFAEFRQTKVKKKKNAVKKEVKKCELQWKGKSPNEWSRKKKQRIVKENKWK